MKRNPSYSLISKVICVRSSRHLEDRELPPCFIPLLFQGGSSKRFTDLRAAHASAVKPQVESQIPLMSCFGVRTPALGSEQALPSQWQIKTGTLIYPAIQGCHFLAAITLFCAIHHLRRLQFLEHSTTHPEQWGAADMCPPFCENPHCSADASPLPPFTVSSPVENSLRLHARWFPQHLIM